jgi:hypothetical protein
MSLYVAGRMRAAKAFDSGELRGVKDEDSGHQI